MVRPRLLVVIPAREGSKGLPGKNVRNLAGKPLICWTIDAAIESGIADKILVSTDIPDIESLVSGAQIEILQRPPNLGGDQVPTSKVLEHALSKFNDFEVVMLLQPTSPLRTALDIKKAYDLFMQDRNSAVVSVTQVTEHPEWMYELEFGESLKPLTQNDSLSRQEAQKLFIPNGAIYICDSTVLESFRYSFKHIPSRAYLMPKDKSIDIDDYLDFDYAEYLISKEV
jgi:N-acylneuraminate cytidylyltransferase